MAPSLLLLLLAQGGELGYADRLALLTVITKGDNGDASLSSVFGDVSAVASKRLGINLISYEEMFAVSEKGVGASVVECGADVRCISSKLRSFNAKNGLVIAIDFSIDPPVIGIQLLDTDAQQMLAEDFAELDPKAISSSIRARVEQVLSNAGYVLAGRIVVDVTPPNAILRLSDGTEPDKGTPNVFTVAAGKYEIRGDAEGWDSTSAQAEIGGGQTTSISLQLVEQTSVLESPWLWIGVGVGVAAITTGVVLGTRQVDRCLCFTLDESGCGCQ